MVGILLQCIVVYRLVFIQNLSKRKCNQWTCKHFLIDQKYEECMNLLALNDEIK